MFKKSLGLGLSVVAMSAMLALTACGGNNDNNADTTPVDTPPPAVVQEDLDEADVTIDIDADAEDMVAGNALADLDELLTMFPPAVVNTNAPIQGGIMRRALVQEASIVGMMLPTQSTNATDATLRNYTMARLFSTNPDLTIGQDGIATWEVDLNTNTFTATMRDDIPTVYWHDGVEFTLDDWLFAFEIISHPDYTGIRFSGAGVHLIVGAEEMKRGEADYISGAVLSEDGRQLVLHFTELPFTLQYAAGLWDVPVARHHWAGIAVADMEDHPNARENHLGNGPWIIENIVPGQAFHFVANPNYWQGRPIMDGIVYEVVSSAVAPLAMQEGRFDRMLFGPSNTREYGHLNNIQILGRFNQSGSFHTFRLGTHHTDDNGNMYFVPRGDRYDNPIQDPLVRHAIGHALDQLSIAMTLGGGLTRPATSVLWPFNARHWMDPNHFGHAPNNPDLANQLLDQAGLTARDAEGYRLDFNGNPWTLTWSQTPGADDDVFLMIRQQNLRDAGIRMELWTGSFVDWNWQMEQIRYDLDTDMDIFTAGWNFGFAPNPSAIWGINEFNRTRWTSDEWQLIHSNIESTQSWDLDHLAYWMARWEQAFYEAAVALPVSYQIELIAVNNRVLNYDITRGSAGTTNDSHLWALSSDTAYAHN
ncbi:MAG: ABC transporter substrate-binding protein [Defluviitaleaceae bacterium]|nr:ABC transporter substrate-binding protein [Defluviitaleaceae bacterium]